MLLLSTLLFQGLIAALWLAGLRLAVRPMAPLTWMVLQVVVVMLPPISVLLLFSEILPLPQAWVLLRIPLWQEGAASLGWPIAIPAIVLLVGTSGIFIAQELLPTVWVKRRIRREEKVADERLNEALARVITLAGRHGAGKRMARLRIYRMASLESFAALHGFWRPVVLVSDGLLGRLNGDDELDAVVAHEAAHLIAGGNVLFFTVWLFRALQAFNPATLVVWRSLILARELAADQVAVGITGRPLDLASALLQRYADDNTAAGSSLVERTRREIVKRAHIASTRLRVDELLGHAHRGMPPSLSVVLAVISLGAVLVWVR